jgi:predicted nucleic acid-binding protein
MSRIPRGPVLFDASVYIRFIREGAYPWLGSDGQLFQRTILTAVVAAELYAGTRSAEEKVQLDSLCLAHGTLGNFSSPKRESWLEAGQMMGRYARRYGSLPTISATC